MASRPPARRDRPPPVASSLRERLNANRIASLIIGKNGLRFGRLPIDEIEILRRRYTNNYRAGAHGRLNAIVEACS